MTRVEVADGPQVVQGVADVDGIGEKICSASFASPPGFGFWKPSLLVTNCVWGSCLPGSAHLQADAGFFQWVRPV